MGEPLSVLDALVAALQRAGYFNKNFLCLSAPVLEGELPYDICVRWKQLVGAGSERRRAASISGRSSPRACYGAGSRSTGTRVAGRIRIRTTQSE